jgi:hypothetical protein
VPAVWSTPWPSTARCREKFLKLTRHGVPFYPVVSNFQRYFDWFDFKLFIADDLLHHSEDLFVFVYSSSILTWEGALGRDFDSVKSNLEKQHSRGNGSPILSRCHFLLIQIIFLYCFSQLY